MRVRPPDVTQLGMARYSVGQNGGVRQRQRRHALAIPRSRLSGSSTAKANTPHIGVISCVVMAEMELTAGESTSCSSLRKGTYPIPLCRRARGVAWQLPPWKWVDDGQANGSYTFLRPDAIASSGLSPESVKKALQRLARRSRVLKAKDYFYVIVSLEYQSAGGPPAAWFVHDVMAAMHLPYYVGILPGGVHRKRMPEPKRSISICNASGAHVADAGWRLSHIRRWRSERDRSIYNGEPGMYHTLLDGHVHNCRTRRIS